MPKRHRSKEDKWRKKLRKYEEKLTRIRPAALSFEDDRDMSTSMSANSSPISRHGHCRSREVSRHRTSPPRHVDPPPLPPDPLPTPAPPPPSLPPPSPPAPTFDDSQTKPPIESSVEATAPLSADPELLQALGIFEVENDEWGPDIIEDLAKRWEPILKDGLKKEEKEEINKKYLYPRNCSLMKPPTLNPEIAAVLTESAKNRDVRLEKKQTQLGCVFAILGRTMSDILTKSINTPDVLKNLSDMAKILADSHHSETDTRRSLISPMVDKTFIDSFKNRKRDSHLFGERLGEFIKNSRGIQKTGKLMQPTTIPTSNNLNSKGPASRSQQQRPSRQPHRAGETRAPQYQHYRRRAPYQTGLNNRPPQFPPAQTTSAQTSAPHSRKQAATSTYKRRQ